MKNWNKFSFYLNELSLKLINFKINVWLKTVNESKGNEMNMRDFVFFLYNFITFTYMIYVMLHAFLSL